MISWKKKFFALSFAFVMICSLGLAVPVLQSQAQASTIVEQRLQEYINANPAGGAAYNCMTFAKEVFKYVFGYEATGIDYHGNTRSDCSMEVKGRLGNTGCGQLTGETLGNVSSESLREMLSSAQPGDIIQAMTGGHGKHTMVLVNADDEGITVYHGNWNGKIAYTTFSYEKFVDKWSHTVTVYHATNYDNINNPLNADPVVASLTLEGNAVYPKAYVIDGVTYYSLRDISYMLTDTPFEFSVSVDSCLNINIGSKLATDGTEMVATDGNKKNASLIETTVKVNNNEVAVSYYEIEGKAYFAIRELADLVGFTVEWNAEDQVTEISFVDDLMDDLLSVDSNVLDVHELLLDAKANM
jgi:hypothetical protein